MYVSDLSLSLPMCRTGFALGPEKATIRKRNMVSILMELEIFKGGETLDNYIINRFFNCDSCSSHYHPTGCLFICFGIN